MLVLSGIFLLYFSICLLAFVFLINKFLWNLLMKIIDRLVKQNTIRRMNDNTKNPYPMLVSLIHMDFGIISYYFADFSICEITYGILDKYDIIIYWSAHALSEWLRPKMIR